MPSTSRYKTVSLKKSDINEAKDKAFDHDADIRFRVRHQVPVFEKSFADVAREYSDFQKRAAQIGQITMSRWKIIETHIRLHLIPYIGNIQITSVGEEKWTEYPFWRKQNNAAKTPKKAHPLHKKPKDQATTEEQNKEANEKEKNSEPANGTIRQEMMTLRAIMNYAADKQYIRERQVPKGHLLEDKNRREEFTLQEYRDLHTYATFRLMEGIDVYFLAKQMGTSVQMIEDYYGHITPAKNAERILQGVPGWEPIAEASGDTPGSVNAGGAGTGALRDSRAKNRPTRRK